MTTLGAVRVSIIRLGEVGSSASLTLDMLTTLLASSLRIEKGHVMTCVLANSDESVYSSVDLIGKLMSSDLK